MIIEQVIKWGISDPRRLFKVDGFGAILSAVLLGIVLVRLEMVFGIPKSTLYFLASLPCLFAIYDFFCYLKIDKNLGPYLKGIAIANLLYCGLSMGLVIHHRDKITYLGWTYILAEISIVIALAIIELRVSKIQG